ncbi:MAG: hypothetical protein ABFD98_07395 [Syntrophobacteraceae bacterium]|nr:hypothetical protein [Desulfobacteraceae bacterium]
MAFFASKDCSKGDPPLSSFLIREGLEEDGPPPPVPSWARELERALVEAREKLRAGVKLRAIRNARRGTFGD